LPPARIQREVDMSKSTSDLETWRLAAAEVPDSASVTLTIPLFVLFGESVDVARFHAKYWKPHKEEGKAPRRGLDSVMKKGQLGPKTGEEIMSLREAVSQAQAQYFLTFNQKGDPMERGRFLLGELTATLEYLLDDGIEDEKDAQLDKIDAAHADDPESFDALASALDDYAAFAELHRNEMDGLGGFDAGHIDEARKVAAELRARPAVGATVSEASRAAIGLRNKLVVLLTTRMSAVRAAGRFVFRGQPEIVREVTSEYERKRRAAGRRKAKKGGAEEAVKVG
jgi:hypothetical protein